MQDRAELPSREENARLWFEEELVPVIAMLREAGLAPRASDADAYVVVSPARYRPMRTQERRPRSSPLRAPRRSRRVARRLGAPGRPVRVARGRRRG